MKNACILARSASKTTNSPIKSRLDDARVASYAVEATTELESTSRTRQLFGRPAENLSLEERNRLRQVFLGIKLLRDLPAETQLQLAQYMRLQVYRAGETAGACAVLAQASHPTCAAHIFGALLPPRSFSACSPFLLSMQI